MQPPESHTDMSQAQMEIFIGELKLKMIEKGIQQRRQKTIQERLNSRESRANNKQRINKDVERFNIDLRDNKPVQREKKQSR